ncbi:IS1 family transposase [Polyangium fumosum]|uniref:IS1 family transposase n=1 Tax=Polyangium fumosum TaxID=889272 RepID=A0A4U1J6T3_9BACT|nr:IS1 family transposase [Polyangium fumosum]TKD03050.1 IS1 family transposase [Polyangium fumosum]
MANFLSEEKRLRVLAALVEGNSERAIERMTGVQQKTIGRLALTLGEGAVNLHNRLARGLQCSLVTVDEIWSYVGKKQARVTPEDGPEVGEAYTFVALDASSRFVIGWYVGKRNEESARAFINDVRARLVVMPAMTSDGFAPYVSAIGSAFGPGVDYAMTVKNYTRKGRRDDDHRYEPPRDPFITKKVVFGAPNLDTASTAYIERNNATMRHHIGRMRRLCYAFSKRLDRHRAAVALNYAWYNLGTVVKTLRVTPAMQLGLTDHVWTIEEFQAALLTAGPCEPPERQPLAPRVPETTARELPNGRGFLRVVGGGKASAGSSHGPIMPPPVVAPAAPVEPVADPTGQLDLLSWRPRSKPEPKGQLSLFPGFDDPKGGE